MFVVAVLLAFAGMTSAWDFNNPGYSNNGGYTNSSEPAAPEVNPSESPVDSSASSSASATPSVVEYTSVDWLGITHTWAETSAISSSQTPDLSYSTSIDSWGNTIVDTLSGSQTSGFSLSTTTDQWGNTITYTASSTPEDTDASGPTETPGPTQPTVSPGPTDPSVAPGTPGTPGGLDIYTTLSYNSNAGGYVVKYYSTDFWGVHKKKTTIYGPDTDAPTYAAPTASASNPNNFQNWGPSWGQSSSRDDDTTGSGGWNTNLGWLFPSKSTASTTSTDDVASEAGGTAPTWGGIPPPITSVPGFSSIPVPSFSMTTDHTKSGKGDFFISAPSPDVHSFPTELTIPTDDNFAATTSKGPKSDMPFPTSVAPAVTSLLPSVASDFGPSKLSKGITESAPAIETGFFSTSSADPGIISGTLSVSSLPVHDVAHSSDPFITTSGTHTGLATSAIQQEISSLFSAASSNYDAMTTMAAFSSITHALSLSGIPSVSASAFESNSASVIVGSGTTETLAPKSDAKPDASVSKWLPSTLVVAGASSATGASLSLSGTASLVVSDHDSPASTSSQGSVPSASSSSRPQLPNAITPATQVQVTDNYTVVTIGFKAGLNYPFVVSHSLASAQIFQYLPQTLTYPFGEDSGVSVKQLVPFQSADLDYIVTVAEVYFPKALVAALNQTVQTPYSKLYFNTDPTENSLAQLIDVDIPLVGLESSSSTVLSGSSGSGSGAAGTVVTGVDGLTGTITGSFDSMQDSGVAANSKLAVVGTTSGMSAAVYISVLLVGYRVYKKKKGMAFTSKDGDIILPIAERGEVVHPETEEVHKKQVLFNPQMPELQRRLSYQSMHSVGTTFSDAPLATQREIFGADDEDSMYNDLVTIHEDGDLETLSEVNSIVPHVSGPSDGWF